jgi:4-hydroxy-tetrahydrodipicolinate synthase
MKKIFEGTGVALITPFYKNKIDYTSLKLLLEKTITEGTSAIILLGTTGEASTISFTERKNLIKFCKEQINNRVKLIVGVGNNNMYTCLKNTKLLRLQ